MNRELAANIFIHLKIGLVSMYEGWTVVDWDNDFAMIVERDNEFYRIQRFAGICEYKEVERKTVVVWEAK